MTTRDTESAAERVGTDGETLTGWVPAETCTLPSGDRPTRLAEFEELFAASLHGLSREGPGLLRLRLHGGADVASRARELTAREAECCGFFDFTVTRRGQRVTVDVRVPPDRRGVLDGVAAQAAAVLAARRREGAGR
ncbi:hypothetical protein [Saccharomonospora piscinae]|uniref:hypothetical protein n=1 Tax=Saccharomonospora piscinae TaxID=687388 RepID=UPI0004B9B134|nr:hypothetical protein [Saccharomonospora piscinae]